VIALAQRPDGSQRVWCDGCRAQAVAPKGRAEPDGWTWTERRGCLLQALFCEHCSKIDSRGRQTGIVRLEQLAKTAPRTAWQAEAQRREAQR